MKNKTFRHIADNLHDDKVVVFTAISAKNFHQRMLISKFVFDQGCVPVNPFTNFGYYLYELVDRDVVSNGNNNLVKRCDELWVFGDISDGILSEIKLFAKLQRPIKYFDISQLPKKISKTSISKLPFEAGLEKFRKEFI